MDFKKIVFNFNEASLFLSYDLKSHLEKIYDGNFHQSNIFIMQCLSLKIV